jgi:hypothetical protein
MPKLSISVPDDLWEVARSVDPAKGQSAIIQAALKVYIKNAPNKQQLIERAAAIYAAKLQEGYNA